MEPLRGGKLAQNLPDEVSDAFNKADVNRTPAEWALRWIWNKPEPSVILSGMNSMAQIEENLKIADEAKPGLLTEKELRIIAEAKKAYKVRIKINCTECGYCQPCPSGVDIPSCFTFYNNYSMFGKEEGYNMWVSPENRASKCEECGLCEEKCPQGLPIREHLKSVKAAFGS
jgi:predicted aldo/keto reductase-like oxidoreductase